MLSSGEREDPPPLAFHASPRGDALAAVRDGKLFLFPSAGK
jgi:hypothetical protein